MITNYLKIGTIVILGTLTMYGPSFFLKSSEDTIWLTYCKNHNIDPDNPTEEQEEAWDVYVETDEYQTLTELLNN